MLNEDQEVLARPFDTLVESLMGEALSPQWKASKTREQVVFQMEAAIETYCALHIRAHANTSETHRKEAQ